ncbi:MFS transporter [Acidiphilium acidophilum]|jgi:Sugar (and other) transporter.|uniref:MFS transporter n=1 Tax=Acidiphilium acidophilum TaxID=76588 RepID=A0AAW9DUP5_ACIAO|nr:MFS transporter [Acidiphilium acidophilum]MDX5932725.1 MFS transporter [Acidiphilium acidophilum]GBQ25218.1 major facilitator superfamily transporter [Acidiphilium acidophilum DSM 700]
MTERTAVSATGITWTRTDTWNFLSFAIGMLAESYAFGVASVATGWVTIPKSLLSLLLAWAPIWLIIGIAISGKLSDRLGRKKMFYITMVLYAVGALGLAFSQGYVLILLFLAIMLLASGGEMNTILVASHELMPPRHRGKATMAAVNFVSIGGLLLAIAAFSSSYGAVPVQRAVVGGFGFVIVILLLYVRGRTPESIRWLYRIDPARAEREALKFYPDQATARLAAIEADMRGLPSAPVSIRAVLREPGMVLKLVCSAMMSFGNAAGYGMITYVVGPYFFKALTDQILLAAGLAAVLSGLIFLSGDRLSRRRTLLFGYIACTGVSLVILLTRQWWHTEAIRFLALVFILNIFINIAYITEDTFKAEIWPTAMRGTMTALVRFISIGFYVVTIFATQTLSITEYLGFNLAVWAIGLCGAFLWSIFGIETGSGADLGIASGEVSPLRRRG